MLGPLESELRAEQEHLLYARQSLAQMRVRVLAQVGAEAGGDAVASELVGAVLRARADLLADDGSRALFFGRTDHDSGERWYIGRRHIADEDGDPVVLDWRADACRAFYRASPVDRMQVRRRRRFGTSGAELTGFEDEDLTHRRTTTGLSAVVVQEIERPRTGPMRDIVATIQPDQDALARAGIETSVVIQGAPGTGKSAVGLHRVAWLLYAHRAQLERSGVLVIGPADAWIRRRRSPASPGSTTRRSPR